MLSILYHVCYPGNDRSLMNRAHYACLSTERKESDKRDCVDRFMDDLIVVCCDQKGNKFVEQENDILHVGIIA